MIGKCFLCTRKLSRGPWGVFVEKIWKAKSRVKKKIGAFWKILVIFFSRSKVATEQFAPKKKNAALQM